jgi:hypothetical protein
LGTWDQLWGRAQRTPTMAESRFLGFCAPVGSNRYKNQGWWADPDMACVHGIFPPRGSQWAVRLLLPGSTGGLGRAARPLAPDGRCYGLRHQPCPHQSVRRQAATV